MANFYFIPTIYQPNTAATNRAISFIKGFSELGVKTQVVYFEPNEGKDTFLAPLENIEFIYYWKSFYWDNKIAKYIILLFYYFHFLIKLKKGDTVLCYSQACIWNLILKWRRGVRIFVEHTEHPEVVGIGGKFLTPSWKNYYRGLNKIEGLFVITSALKQFFVDKGVCPDRIHITNIVVDTKRFDGLKESASAMPYVAYCGTASNNKDGVDQLIKAFSIVSKTHPDLQLHIAGKIPDNDEAGNLQLIKDLGLIDKVVLKGIIGADLMPQFLKDAVMLALDRPGNTQAKYGFATKMGEYLMTGNPVVVTDVGDFHLFLKDKESAILTQPDNVNAFADGLKWVFEHPDLSEKIGMQGRQVALSEFSYTAVSSKLLVKMFS